MNHVPNVGIVVLAGVSSNGNPFAVKGDSTQITVGDDANPRPTVTKSHERPNVQELMPFYEDLVAEFFPATLN